VSKKGTFNSENSREIHNPIDITRICSIYGSHNHVFSSFMIYKNSNMLCVICGSRTAYLSGAPGFVPFYMY